MGLRHAGYYIYIYTPHHEGKLAVHRMLYVCPVPLPAAPANQMRALYIYFIYTTFVFANRVPRMKALALLVLSSVFSASGASDLGCEPGSGIVTVQDDCDSAGAALSIDRLEDVRDACGSTNIALSARSWHLRWYFARKRWMQFDRIHSSSPTHLSLSQVFVTKVKEMVAGV